MEVSDARRLPRETRGVTKGALDPCSMPLTAASGFVPGAGKAIESAILAAHHQNDARRRRSATGEARAVGPMGRSETRDDIRSSIRWT